MYAVFASGGKQQRVEVDTLIDVEKLEVPVGEEVTLSNVLAIGDDEGHVKVGTPYLENAAVIGEVVQQGKEKKIIVFKSKRRTGYKRKLGHRQRFTRLRITEIQHGNNTSEEVDENGT
ncbi:MAG: 50S ribosomal protein L21 [Candidatus Poribacteria bacterium]|nr:50S ribosomal protein L21 [Candidatus Poribacteria bacterium]